ncbi:arylsulfatase I-like [Tigriopus californicus]|uniref:arylsulfatase I-like n=1 Tax=Tigriopus californicus TaxID=6832 RepID=UPI0027D9FE25|nr:arylsulfatase I-like [Tigriopus californicus]
MSSTFGAISVWVTLFGLALFPGIRLINGDQAPNIVFIVADDLGFNDISWNNPKIISPNLDSLARNGTILNHNYVLPICSPTRSALMTGYYSVHTGRQSSVIWQQEPVGLFTNFTLMPEHLNTLGYESHAVGKWHLGYCNQSYLPTNRGFKSFNGYFIGSEDYYSHLRPPSVGGGPPGYDFQHNEGPDLSANGTYSSVLIGLHAEKIIRDHALQTPEKPLFLYLPFQNVHSPLQVPDHYSNLYPNETNQARKTFSGMVTAMDDAVGTVVKSLKSQGLFENTIIVFSSDNGGQTMSGGNNFPLRGNKGTLWEGGTRVPGFVHIPFSKNRARNVSSLFHVTDWLPTLYRAGGGDPHELGPIDGLDQWNLLVGNQDKGVRQEFLYNIQPIPSIEGAQARAAIRVGDFKLLRGVPGEPSGWIPPAKSVDIPLERNNHLANLTHFQAVPNFASFEVRLYNITSDPEERVDLSHNHPDIVESMLAKLARFDASMIPPNIKPEVASGNPNRFNGIYTPGWCQAQPK